MQAVKILPNGIAVLENDTHISKWVEESGRLDHDFNTLTLLDEFLPEGGWVVDGGAFIGDHTIYYSKHVGPTGRVLAFEPNLDAYACLVQNCPEAAAFPLGLDAVAAAYQQAISPNAGASHLDADVEAFGERVVKTIPLDYLLPLIPRLDFMKLDLEGFEVDALTGAMATIRRHQPVMLVEMSKGAQERNYSSEKELIHCIEHLGYNWRILQDNCALGDPQYDLLCVPKIRG